MTPAEACARDVMRVAVFEAKVRLFLSWGLISHEDARGYLAAAMRVAFRRMTRHVAREITINALRDYASGKASTS